jgi:hypothetical protein
VRRPSGTAPGLTYWFVAVAPARGRRGTLPKPPRDASQKSSSTSSMCAGRASQAPAHPKDRTRAAHNQDRAVTHRLSLGMQPGAYRLVRSVHPMDHRTFPTPLPARPRHVRRPVTSRQARHLRECSGNGQDTTPDTLLSCENLLERSRMDVPSPQPEPPTHPDAPVSEPDDPGDLA